MAPTLPAIQGTESWNLSNPGLPPVFESYEILGIIGHGGMGTVYKAFHTNLKHHAAIKTLRVHADHRADLVNRFLREMAVIGQMDHKHVVRAADGKEKNGILYLVMEYLEGCDLGRLVGASPLPLGLACELVRQAALGLEYIHGKGFVHRDIKPTNLFVTTEGIVKVLDLGLGRHALGEGEELTPQGHVIGTYAYMAPEQAIAGAAIDARADLYSLGCTLFKLLTGQTPFSGSQYDDPPKKIYAHCNIPLTDLEAFQAVPEEIRPILLKMTSKKPEERYQTAREVIEELTALAGSGHQFQDPSYSASGPDQALQLLPATLPEDLSRLLAEQGETAHGLASRTKRFEFFGKPRKLRWTVGLMVLAVLLIGFIWRVELMWRAPLEKNQKPDQFTKTVVEPTGPYRLDNPDHQGRTIDLLEKPPPLPIAHDQPDAKKWQWFSGGELHLKGDSTLFFPLAEVTRTHYFFTASINQHPWSGNVGIAWGYHEDPEVKQAKEALADFAWFQTLCILRPDPKNANHFTVGRGLGKLRYNPKGDIGAHLTWWASQKITLGSGEATLSLEVRENRLAIARLSSRLGVVELRDLHAANVKPLVRTGHDHYQGVLGVFSSSASATFSNVKAMPLSKN